MLNPNAVGATAGPVRRSWSSDDALLYALAVGAGPDDLALVTENSEGVEQVVLPTFVALLAGGSHGLKDASPGLLAARSRRGLRRGLSLR